MRRPENRMQSWPVGDCRRALVPQAAGEALVEEAVAPFDIPPCGCFTTWVLMPVTMTPLGTNKDGLLDWGAPVLLGLYWTTHTTHRQACARANA